MSVLCISMFMKNEHFDLLCWMQCHSSNTFLMIGQRCFRFRSCQVPQTYGTIMASCDHLKHIKKTFSFFVSFGYFSDTNHAETYDKHLRTCNYCHYLWFSSLCSHYSDCVSMSSESMNTSFCTYVPNLKVK